MNLRDEIAAILQRQYGIRLGVYLGQMPDDGRDTQAADAILAAVRGALMADDTVRLTAEVHDALAPHQGIREALVRGILNTALTEVTSK